MNTSEIVELTRYCLDECGVDIEFKVEFNNRLVAKVATALLLPRSIIRPYPKGIVTISSKWWKVLPDDEKENMVVHEACHLAAGFIDSNRVRREGLRGHGSFWQSLHWKCGLKPQRYCHQPHLRQLVKPTFDVCCLGCGKIYRATKTLITRRLNKYGSVGNCNVCKTKLIPSQQYYVKMTNYATNYLGLGNK